MRIKLNRKRERLISNWLAYLLVLTIVVVAIFFTSCTSQSGQLLENRISERCVVIDTYNMNVDGAPARSYLKVLRVSDNTIHAQLTHQTKLFVCGDTLLLPFDKRYDY